MDTTKLVVGQNVYMLCSDGVCMLKGHVVKITPEGVDVQFGAEQVGGALNAYEMKHFDKDGKERGERTYDFYHYELDDMPFAERTALRKQKS